jgi:hypothetical protein
VLGPEDLFESRTKSPLEGEKSVFEIFGHRSRMTKITNIAFEFVLERFIRQKTIETRKNGCHITPQMMDELF